jgi:hypothetical protein
VSDRLVLGEIFYQTILQGFNTSLVKDKKRAFIPYGFYVGYHFVKDTTQAKKEAQNQVEYRFYTSRYRKHDPRNLVAQHASQVVSHWPYAHDTFEDEIFTENSQDWEEFLLRKSNPKMTRFKEMSMDEQVQLIEKIVEVTTQVQGREELGEKEARRDEIERHLEEIERNIQEHGPIQTTLVGPPIITPVSVHMEEGELTTPGDIPTGEHNEQQGLEKIPTGKP